MAKRQDAVTIGYDPSITIDSVRQTYFQDVTQGYEPIASVSVTSATTLFSLDVSGFSSIAVQVTSAGTTCTITYEVSLDNANWIAINGNVPGNAGTSSPASTSTTIGILTFQIGSLQYFRARVSTYTSGTVSVQAYLSAAPSRDGAVFVGTVGSISTSNSYTAATAGSSNALLAASVIRLPSAAASTNATVVKASAGRVYKVSATNTTAAVKYLKLYNKTTAPTVGTDTPVWTAAIPVSLGYWELNFADIGLYFSTGIGFALTGAAADADATALAAGDVVGLNVAFL